MLGVEVDRLSGDWRHAVDPDALVPSKGLSVRVCEHNHVLNAVDVALDHLVVQEGDLATDLPGELVAELALLAAGRVVGETMSEERERRLVDEFLTQVSASTPSWPILAAKASGPSTKFGTGLVFTDKSRRQWTNVAPGI